MEKTHKIEPRQREALVEMLREAKRKKSSELEASSGISEASVVRTLAIESGAQKLVKETEELHEAVREAQSRLNVVDADLRKLGFEWTNSRFYVHYGAPGLDKKVRDILAEKRGPIEKSLKKYDLAIADIWTVDTNADASKVIEGLI